MPSEYDPLFVRDEDAPTDPALEEVRQRFAAAAGPYLSAPLLWLAWALLLPAAALATRPAADAGSWPAVLLAWSGAILAGGLAEWGALRGRRHRRTALATWALRVQGNLSVVALAISLALLLTGRFALLPSVWLLLVGHSLYTLGGLAFPPMRTAGLLYQLGGLAALWPAAPALSIFAATTAAANLWLAWHTGRRGPRDPRW